MKKISITSNILKIIGITCMIFDHIGYYFFENIDIDSIPKTDIPNVKVRVLKPLVSGKRYN